jgi:hypothetical protein
MGRQLFQDGPYIDPPITAPGAFTPGSIAALWPAAAWTPIYANDPKAGKIYCVRAGGVVTMSVNTATLVVTPKYGTGGTSLGASPAQLLPVMSALPWTLDAELVFSFIGVSTASKAFLSGKFCCQGTIATPGAGTVIPFGGTQVTNLDATILSNIEINVTLGGTVGTPSIQTIYAYIFSRN